MKRAVAVVGITIVGLAVVLAAAVQLSGDKREVSVELTMQKEGCKAVDNVDTLQGSKLRPKLTWHIINHCATPQNVWIQDFKKRVDGSPGQAENDLVKPYPVMVSVAQGAPADADAHIQKFKFFATYKYDICVGADSQNQLCIDPDVDVWPF